MENFFKNKGFVQAKNIINFSLILSSIYSAQALAANSYKGLQYGTKEDPFWLQINGALKLDQRLFLAKKDNLKSGASIRELSLNFNGGLNKDISVSIGLGFDPKDSKVNIEDAYVTYSGFKGFGENFRVSIGKVNPSFCLENHSSGKWIPFLEKSSVTTAFKPDQGLGISINKWQDDYSFNASITQPKPNDVITDENEVEQKRSDHWQYNFRATKAYIYGKNQLIQGGIFGHYKHDAGAGIAFSTTPEFKTRYSNIDLLNTQVNLDKSVAPGPNGAKLNSKIKSKQHYTIGAEILAQRGPFSFEVEYQFTKVNRDQYQSPNNLRFRGYRSNINYVLTGESRNFRSSDGTLGQVIPEKESGAWEISGRYDYLNLNNKDIKGGSAHHTGVAATWYANHNFATTIEYVSSKIHKRITLDKININTIGARLQLVF